MNRRYKDLTGLVINRLTVLEVCEYKTPDGRMLWKCKCSCGSIKDIRGDHVQNGNSYSCGCLQKEHALKGKHKHTKRGYKSRTYGVWDAMIQRTSNPNNSEYYRYGSRGITVCPAWLEFSNFLADMGEAPVDLYLDRIDPNLGYNKDNCRWVSKSLSSFNTRKKANNTSGRTGVQKTSKSGKWFATIRKERKIYYLGQFDTFEEACKAREEAELKYYGFNKE